MFDFLLKILAFEYIPFDGVVYFFLGVFFKDSYFARTLPINQYTLTPFNSLSFERHDKARESAREDKIPTFALE